MTSRDLAAEPSFALALRGPASRMPHVDLASVLLPRATARLRSCIEACKERSGFTDKATERPLPLHGALPHCPKRIDPTWYWTSPGGEPAAVSPALRAALATLPEPLRTAVCQVGGLSPDSGPLFWAQTLCVAAARKQWCHLCDMPEERGLEASRLGESAPPAALALALASLPALALHGAVLHAGGPAFGSLLRHLPDRAAAGLCARLPAPLRESIWRSRRQGGPSSQGSSRLDLMLLHAQLGVTDTARLVFTLGARVMAAFLQRHAPVALRQAAQGLPLPAGRLLLEAPIGAVPPPSFLLECMTSGTSGDSGDSAT